MKTPADIKDWRGVPASHIHGKLWQSGFPPFAHLTDAGVDLIVLAAAEAQPKEDDVAAIKKNQPGLSMIVCPLHDVEDPVALPRIVKIASGVAKRVAERIRSGRTALITCAVGRNRSGLITALTLRELYGFSGKAAADVVRSSRAAALPKGEDALSNDAFRKYLESLPAVST